MEPAIMYARSRSRVATTLLLTAPGIPMLFMGQEILEDKPWHEDIRFWSQFMIWWDGLSVDRSMRDFLRFTQDLIQLRRRYPALCGEGMRVPEVHNHDRIIVVHRWLEGEGRDLLVVASLNETHSTAIRWTCRGLAAGRKSLIAKCMTISQTNGRLAMAARCLPMVLPANNTPIPRESGSRQTEH